jgi:hypothetical protein
MTGVDLLLAQKLALEIIEHEGSIESPDLYERLLSMTHEGEYYVDAVRPLILENAVLYEHVQSPRYGIVGVLKSLKRSNFKRVEDE